MRGKLGVREGAPEAGVTEHAKDRKRRMECHLWKLEEVGWLEEPWGLVGWHPLCWQGKPRKSPLGSLWVPTLFLSLDLVSALPVLPLSKPWPAASGALHPQYH